MATRKTEETVQEAAPAIMEQDPWKRNRTVYIPRGADKRESEWVCVNGRPYMVPLGKNVEVPEPVAEVIEHAQHAAEWAADEKKRMAEGR